jgi:hypothetical protein
MSPTAWITIVGMAITNLVALMAGLIHLTSRLARIETDLKWVKRNCPKCPQNSDENTL